MSWIRGTSVGHITLSNDVLSAITGTSVLTVGINSGGTGYTVGDILTIAGGTSSIAAQAEVTSVAAGVIDGIRMYNGGDYSVAPSTPNSATGGTGSGASLTLTTGTKGWTQNADAVWDGGSERQVMIEGNGGGSDEIFVGWRTYSNAPSSRYNWELHGMTGYSSGLPINSQPGVSPGDHEQTGGPSYGCYVPLLSTSMDWYMSVDSFRIILVVVAGANVYPMYLGFINRFATATEYPYPVMVAGCSDDKDATAAQSERMSALVHPWSTIGSTEGPSKLIDPAGTWLNFCNCVVSGNLNNASNNQIVTPAGRPAAVSNGSTPLQDRWSPTATANLWNNIIKNNGTIQQADGNLEPTPGTADSYPLFPCTLMKSETTGANVTVYGEIDDCFWMSGFGSVTSEDRIIQGSDVYRVFTNCNGSLNFDYFAVKEV